MIDAKLKNEVRDLAAALHLLANSADEMSEGTLTSWLVYHAGYMTNLATMALGSPNKLAICTIDAHDPDGLRNALATAIGGLEMMSHEYCALVADDKQEKAAKVIARFDEKFIQGLRDALNHEGAGRVKPMTRRLVNVLESTPDNLRQHELDRAKGIADRLRFAIEIKDAAHNALERMIGEIMFNEQEGFTAAFFNGSLRGINWAARSSGVFTADDKERFARYVLRCVPNDEIAEDLIEQLRKWVPE